MPLLKKSDFNKSAHLILWQITEDEDQLRQRITMHPSDSEKFARLAHPVKRREFLALRCCLQEYFGYNPPVHYQPSGKPYLRKEGYISFAHTQDYAGVIVSPYYPVGLDLETYRPGIRQVASKYLRDNELKAVGPDEDITDLIRYWGAKEAMIKITGNRRLDLKKNLRVAPFGRHQLQPARGLICSNGQCDNVKFYFWQNGPLHITIGWRA